MAQILDPLPSDSDGSILCCYVNATSQIQIARIANIINWYFERVVFPGQRLVFESVPEAVLEIHTGMMASAIISDKISCARLCMDEENQSDIGLIAAPSQEKTHNNQKIHSHNKKTRQIAEPLTTAAIN